MNTPQALAALSTRGPNGAVRRLPPLLLQYWHAVVRRRLLLGAIVLAAILIAAAVTTQMTPHYTATTQIDVSRDQKRVTNVEAIEPVAAGRSLEFYQTQYALLKARSLAERVGQQLGLPMDDAFFAAHGITWNPRRSTTADGRFDPARDMKRRSEATTRLLLAHIVIKPIPQSSLINISYTSHSPAWSARIANAWVAQFIEAGMARRYASTSDAQRFLEGRLADLRRRLEQSERNAVDYANGHAIIALSTSQNADGQTRAERTLIASDLEAANAALARATDARVDAESRYRNSTAATGNSDPALGAILANLRQARAQADADHAKMVVQFGDQYPPLKAIEQQRSSLDASIAREEERAGSALSDTYRQAVAREAELRGRVGQLTAALEREQSSNIQYAIYQRDADTNRQLYENLLQRYKEIGVAGVGANNVAVVDVARPPDTPSSPRLLLNLGLGLIVGLLLAAATLVALEHMAEGISDPSQVARDLDLPLLGIVPAAKHGEVLPALQDSSTDVSEAYVAVVSSLAFATDHGVPRALMVTSTCPGEGKSSTSIALATVLGRLGKTVLLIDGDMRDPSINRSLGFGNDRGLSNVLAGEDQWQRLVQPGPSTGVSVMTSGPLPPSAAELLSSHRLATLIAQGMEQYDHVIVDTPPMLGFADAQLIASVVEGIVYIVEVEGVSARGVLGALDRLRSARTRVIGAVLTKVSRRQASYGYGYGHGYGYGQKAGR